MKSTRNLLGFFIISILGSLFHFMYEWTGKGLISSLFFPVNESTWEHLKLIFYPTVIYSIIEIFFIKENRENYIFATISAIFYGMLVIIVLFYTYTGVLGFNIDFLNIAIFYIAVIAVLNRRNKILNRSKHFSENCKLLLGVIFGLTAFLFGVWSMHHPNLNIFIPPTSV